MDKNVFCEINQGNLSNRVAEEIKDAIQRGKIQPGERIVERDIAKQMGVSQAPVREAIQILNQQGLLYRVPRMGTFVRRLSKKDIVELFSLRAILESFAITLFIDQCGEEEIAQLEDIINRIREAAKKGNALDVSLNDIKFHQTITRCSGHKSLCKMSDSIAELTFLYLIDMNRLYPDLKIVIDDHLILLEVIKSGDKKKSAQAIIDHMLDGARTLLKEMPDDQSAALDIEDLGLDELYR